MDVSQKDRMISLRLSDESLAKLELISGYLLSKGRRHSRSEAVRYAVDRVADVMPKEGDNG